MPGIEEIADVIWYRCEKCFECVLGDGYICNLYERRTDEDKDSKPDWCHVERVKIEFRR